MRLNSVAVQRKFEDVSDIIKPFVDCIGSEAHQPNLIDQVRTACSESRAFIFMLPEGDSFVVLRPLGADVVQIWIAYSKENDAMIQYLPTVKALSHEIGATHIELETSVEKLNQILPALGWGKKHTVWRQAIDE